MEYAIVETLGQKRAVAVLLLPLADHPALAATSRDVALDAKTKGVPAFLAEHRAISRRFAYLVALAVLAAAAILRPDGEGIGARAAGVIDRLEPAASGQQLNARPLLGIERWPLEGIGHRRAGMGLMADQREQEEESGCHKSVMGHGSHNACRSRGVQARAGRSPPSSDRPVCSRAVAGAAGTLPGA